VAAASPPPTSTPAAPSTSAGPTAPPPRPRAGALQDVGTVRRDSVEAESWTSQGTVKVTGDVRVGEADLEGTVSIGGKLTAAAFRSRGELEVEGPIDVSGLFTGSVGLRATLTFHAGDADLRGNVHVLGAVTVDRTLHVRGNLEAPSLAVGLLKLEGTAQVPGDLVAASVSARLVDDSTFGQVRARSVSLRARIPNLVEKVLGRRVTVTVRRVEADEVVLEGVEAQFVRAPKISLGRDAHLTEYEGTIVRAHPTSRVGFESRSPPPYGLRR
jgi:cytoskeletal protein CcmA (bactofilin family)